MHVSAPHGTEDGSVNFLGKTATSPELKWISSDKICQYTVQEDFAPQSDGQHKASFWETELGT